MNGYLEIVLRTILAIAFIFFLARLTGAKQISQLTFYDYIVGITAGSIAAQLSFDLEADILYCLIAILLFMLSSLFMAFLTNKSIGLRRLLTGRPVFLIAQGKLYYDGLKRAHFDVNDLTRELRSQGYFDINQINYAILETNGVVSVMPKAADRPATVSELSMKLPEDEILSDVIIDGKILKGNLKAYGKDRDWLMRELERQKVSDIKNVLLGTLSTDGTLNVYYKEQEDTKRTVFQ